MIAQRLLRLLPAVLPALLWTQTASAASAPDEFVGQGWIQVLNNSDYNTASLSDSIGCLNIAGQLTANDCAVFTNVKGVAFPLATEAGNCTIQNPDMPVNTDSYYGKNSHAFWCGEKGDWPVYDEYYYSIDGFKHPFICTADIGCNWDVKATVPEKGDALPVWRFAWGGEQMDIEAGHWRVLWLWVPVDKE